VSECKKGMKVESWVLPYPEVRGLYKFISMAYHTRLLTESRASGTLHSYSPYEMGLSSDQPI
jgi:hypothetical protein